MYVGVIKGKSFLSQIVRIFQGGYEYTHVLVLDGNDVYEAKFDFKKSGVQSYDVSELTESVRWFEVAEDVDRAAFRTFLKNQVGKKYDWLGAFGLPFRVKTENKKRWFCSELVFKAFAFAGVDLLENTKAWEVGPRLLLRSPLLKEVDYELF